MALPKGVGGTTGSPQGPSCRLLLLLLRLPKGAERLLGPAARLLAKGKGCRAGRVKAQRGRAAACSTSAV